MPKTLYHEKEHAVKWYPFPAYKPAQKGRYLVTFRRPSAGKWVAICKWVGLVWDRNADVTAWMVLPERFGSGGRDKRE